MNKLTLSLAFLLLVISVTAHADDKVVVVPLGSSWIPAKMIYASGRVDSEGSLLSYFGKKAIVSRPLTGMYLIEFPNYTGFPGEKTWPTILISRESGVGSQTAYAVGFGPNKTMRFGLTAYNLSGTLTNLQFSFVIVDQYPLTRSASSAAKMRTVGNCVFPPWSDATSCD